MGVVVSIYFSMFSIYNVLNLRVWTNCC